MPVQDNGGSLHDGSKASTQSCSPHTKDTVQYMPERFATDLQILPVAIHNHAGHTTPEDWRTVSACIVAWSSVLYKGKAQLKQPSVLFLHTPHSTHAIASAPVLSPQSGGGKFAS